MWERIKALITENLNLKLLSFAFALVLYSLVHGGQDARGSISVDLEANLPGETADKVLVSSIPRDVRIFVRGSTQTIDNLRGGSVHIILDLQKSPEHVVFTQAMVRLPEGLRVEVAHGDDLHPLELVEVANEVRPPVAEADDADSEPMCGSVAPAHAVPVRFSTWIGVRQSSERSSPSDHPRT